MPKKVLVALPPRMLEQIDFIASVEHRTRSELIREALRRYTEEFNTKQGGNLNVRSITDSNTRSNPGGYEAGRGY